MKSKGIRYLASTLVVLLLCFTPLAGAVEIIKSPNDNRDYLAFELDNGLKVMVISDPGTDKAAASLEVGTGSGDDPAQRQGLAHFLEHMLFLGTSKYPTAGEYQSYLSAHSGSHNAFTAHDRTNYFFSIDNDYLEPTLDRFARFFIDPLFSPEYVEREKHAVHSEYQSRLKEDSSRSHAVFRQVINPRHPAANFAVGSLDTLADRPGATVRDDLIGFYEQNYSADEMSLVVLGAGSTDQLKAVVESKFNAVPRRKTDATVVTEPLFRAGQLPATVRVQSIREMHQLTLSFPVPPIRPHFEKRPVRYISALLGHEGPGSLLDTLKQRGLAKHLSAGLGINNEDSATLTVRIDLTAEGFERYDEIVDLSFQYLQLIKQSGVQPWIFNEELQISATAFRFKENGNPTSYVTRLANNLDRYPLAEVIHGDFLYGDYDPRLINDYLDYLRPDNVLVTLTARDTTTDQVDPWYSTPYSLAPLAPSQVKAWSGGEIDPALKISAPNIFLPSDFSLRANNASGKPEVIRSLPGYRLWFKQDQKFRIPKANFYFTFRSPVANNSARHHVLTSLFVSLVNDRLNAFIYPANVAGFKTDLYANLRGFSLRLGGYRDKQLLLLARITDTLKNLEVDPARLEIFRTDLRRRLENSRKEKPYSQTLDEVYRSVLHPQWPIEAQLLEVDSITKEEMQNFSRELLHSGEIEALAHGDLLPGDALLLSEILEKDLLAGIDVAAVADGEVRLLGGQVEVKDLNVEHNDSAVSTYLQADNAQLSTRARYALLANILSPPFYNEMRTEKQLGYIVFASAMPILEHPALALVIQSSSATPDQLQSHIEGFMTDSLALIESVSEEELAGYKQSLLVELLKKDQKLSDRSKRYWREIDRRYEDFNSRELLAAAIRAVDIGDLLDTFRSLSRRQLVVRSAGQTLSWNPASPLPYKVASR
jgi:insulysin